MYTLNARRILFALLVSLVLSADAVPVQESASSNTLSTSTLTSSLGKGFGADTRGGLDGKVIKVTNLNRDGEGSLAWAMAQAYPRLVVFEVAGVIDLAGKSLQINEPFLSIAGQTAPSPGITLIRGGLSVRTHDVRIEHIHVRPGDNGQAKRSGWNSDAISVSGGRARDVLINHVSVSWATDENLSASGRRTDGPGQAAQRVTFANSIIAEGLDYASHIKGKHSKGLLVHDFVGHVAVVGNLFISNDRRNPYFKSKATGVVVNNLIFNPGNAAVQVGFVEDEWKGSRFQPEEPSVAVVGNMLRYGRDTYSDLALVANRGNVFLRDNQVINLEAQAMPQTQGTIRLLQTAPVWPEGLKVLPLAQVESSVLATAGARPWDRDPTDLRILRDYKSGLSRIIDSQEEVGGYPRQAPVSRPLEVPSTGIEAWLASFGVTRF